MHTRDLCGYLAELAENNNRAWFVMNKPRYDILRAEFLELVTVLIREIARFDPEVADCNPKKALFRINRDIRFSHDKSPYKTHFSASITATGLKKPSQGGGPAYYFHIDQEGKLLFAAGEYMPPNDRLRALRHHIANDPKGFAKVLKDKRFASTYGDLADEGKLVRPPKGFDPQGPHIEYIKMKSVIAWQELSIKRKVPPDMAAFLAERFHDGYALVQWLRKTPAVAATPATE